MCVIYFICVLFVFNFILFFVFQKYVDLWLEYSLQTLFCVCCSCNILDLIILALSHYYTSETGPYTFRWTAALSISSSVFHSLILIVVPLYLGGAWLIEWFSVVFTNILFSMVCFHFHGINS